jgi:hypothetical protein
MFNPVVSKCYRCRDSLTDTGTTVQNKGSECKYENNVEICIPTGTPAPR